jgi:hypothetical protein
MKKPNDKKRPNSNSKSLGQFLRWREYVHGYGFVTKRNSTHAAAKRHHQQVRDWAPNMSSLTMGLIAALSRGLIRRRAA